MPPPYDEGNSLPGEPAHGAIVHGYQPVLTQQPSPPTQQHTTVRYRALGGAGGALEVIMCRGQFADSMQNAAETSHFLAFNN